MENGLNFGKPLRLLAGRQKSGKRGWNGSGMFAYIVPASISCYYRRCKRILGEGNFVPYRAYWALKQLKKM
jgi:hypothetical protein